MTPLPRRRSSPRDRTRTCATRSTSATSLPRSASRSRSRAATSLPCAPRSMAGALGTMLAVYRVVVPHEERYLRATFGAAFDEYVAAVPPVIPRTSPGGSEAGTYDPSVIAQGRVAHVHHVRRDARGAGASRPGKNERPRPRARSCSGRQRSAQDCARGHRGCRASSNSSAASPPTRWRLLSDAAHVTMDVVALAIALAASIQSARPANERQTFGFARLEILAGLGNSALLLAVTILIVVEAVRRLHASRVARRLADGRHRGDRPGRERRYRFGDAARGQHFAEHARGAAARRRRRARRDCGRDRRPRRSWRPGAGWIDPALSLFVSAIILAGIVNVSREAMYVLLESVPGHARLPLGARERFASATASSTCTTCTSGRSAQARTRSRRTSCSTTAA